MNAMIKNTFFSVALLAAIASVGCKKNTEATADAAVATVEEAAAPVAEVVDTGVAAPVATATAVAPAGPFDLPEEGDAVGKASAEITPQGYKAEMDKLEGELANPGY